MKTDPKDAIWLDAQHVKDGPETPEEAIVDMLADIRHYCVAYELDFDTLSETALGHFTEEARPVQWEDHPSVTEALEGKGEKS